MPGVHRMPHTRDPRCKFLKTDEGCIWCCELCDHDAHVCAGCGCHVSHLGNDLETGGPHECALVST
jgi:hypothetical protein